MNRLKAGHWLAAAVLAAAACTAQAQQDGEGKGHRKPPAEAFAACKGKSEGDKVSVTMREHTLDATCEKVGDQLAARPSRRPEGAPPREP